MRVQLLMPASRVYRDLAAVLRSPDGREIGADAEEASREEAPTRASTFVSSVTRLRRRRLRGVVLSFFLSFFARERVYYYRRGVT